MDRATGGPDLDASPTITNACTYKLNSAADVEEKESLLIMRIHNQPIYSER